MRHQFSRTTLIRFSTPLLLVAVAALAGCADNTASIGGSTGTTTGTTTGTGTTPTAVAGTLALGTDKNFILADNSTAATLTATLVDASNALMPGATIQFSTTTGNLSASTAITDASGQAVVTLKSGLSDFSNRTAVVTATAGGQTASIPIDITGSTVALAIAPSNSVQVDAGTLTATATVTNASSFGLANQTVRFSIGANSTGAATLSASTMMTDASGVTPQVTFTPTAAGNVVLMAEWLNSAGTVLATATSTIVVTPAAGTAFSVTTPVTDPTGLTTSATQLVTVSVPSIIGNEDLDGDGVLDTEDTNGNKVLDAGEDANGNGFLDTEDTNGNGKLELGVVANVRLSATSGTFVGITQATAESGSILQTPASGLVAANYTAPMNSGSVTIQVDALDAVGTTLSSLSRTFVVSAPASAAARLIMGSSASAVPPSSGGNTRTATLRVQVQDANYNAVGGAAVLFGLLATTGSGETISPAVVLTDSFGEATTTFSAGTAPTVGDIYAQARIVGGGDCTFDPSTGAAETNPLCKAIPLKVASNAVSVTVGFGTTVGEDYDATQYRLPGSVLVVDSNGGPVAGVTVTLSAFPAYYRNGAIVIGRAWTGSGWDLRCMGPYDTRTAYWDDFSETYSFLAETQYVAAEDVNRNGILDPGEDTLGNGVIDTWGPNEDANLNGILDQVTEDTNFNGQLDPGEDLNGNFVIDVIYTEDANNNGILDPNTEDVNLNGILDFGEDTPIAAGPRNAQAVAANGLLSPPQAAGGTVPLTVTTDSNGAAAFDLRYPKAAAWFIKTEVMARVIVMGTESTAKVIQPLMMLQFDAEMDGCPLAREATY